MIDPMPHVAQMAPYALADLSEFEPGSITRRQISLSQNESLRGPSPHAVAAAQAATAQAHLYPDPDWTALREAIAAQHGVSAGDILCGNGSLDLIGCISRAFLGPGRTALAPAHAYPFFQTATRMAGAQLEAAPEQDLHADVDALLNAVAPQTRVVFFANPGNPTGTRLPRSEVLRLRQGLPDHVLLVLDEAYGEFADHLGEPMFDLMQRGDTVILRSFSKAYGLAGARVGWGVFPPEIAREIRKLLNPNAVTLASQAAARAAVEDQAWMRETCAETARIRDSFATRLRALGFAIPDSFTNFTLIPFASPADAAEADAYLKSQGIFLRPQSGAGLPHALRATIGPSADMEVAADLMETWLRERPAP